jgi:hypothetical protein
MGTDQGTFFIRSTGVMHLAAITLCWGIVGGFKYGGLEYVGHYFACIAHFVFVKDVLIQTRELPYQAGALPT